MSPSSRETINNPNAALRSKLKTSKESHIIHKPSSSSASSTINQPVIIYTSSPKVIHTKARDFMALVQKLTGLEANSDHFDNGSSGGIQEHPPPPPPPPPPPFEYPAMEDDYSDVLQLTSSSIASSCSVSPSEGVSNVEILKGQSENSCLSCLELQEIGSPEDWFNNFDRL